MNKRITHRGIYEINALGVFDNVNSYDDMNRAIIALGKAKQKEHELAGGNPEFNAYNYYTGLPFEIFNQHFGNRYGDTPLLGMRSIVDTSDDPYNEGFDFLFTSLLGELGQDQSKFRSNPMHSFTRGELATMDSTARGREISRYNNILFTNITYHDKFFHHKYKSDGHRSMRIVDRHAQEELILRDPKFWEEFRAEIKRSALEEFRDPPLRREIQNWIRDGHEELLGTRAVLSGKVSKGRVRAGCGAGKTLCQYDDVFESFFQFGRNIVVQTEPSKPLIDQTFGTYYSYGLFTKYPVSVCIIKSGGAPPHNPLTTHMCHTLDVDEAVEFIAGELLLGRKVLIMITMRSQELKFTILISKLKERGVEIDGPNIIDEIHELIPTNISLGERELLYQELQSTTNIIGYSASDKDGRGGLNTFNEELFGPLLADVSHKDARDRGYVRPHIRVRLIRMSGLSIARDIGSELQNCGKETGVDLRLAVTEAAALAIAYNQEKADRGREVNGLLASAHVPTCEFVAKSPALNKFLSSVNRHFAYADTAPNIRNMIFNTMRESLGNLLLQHSIAGVGIDIPNLDFIILGRVLGLISLQQYVGRASRVENLDTLDFEAGRNSLNSPVGWRNYYSTVYIIVDDTDVDGFEFFKYVKGIINLLENEYEIPRDMYDISVLTDDRTNPNNPPDNDPWAQKFLNPVSFTEDNLQHAIDKARVELEIERTKEEVTKIISEVQNLNENELLNALVTL